MKRRMLELNQLKDNTKIVLGGFEMKKKAMALVMVAATAISLMAGSLSVSAATDPDTSARKRSKFFQSGQRIAQMARSLQESLTTTSKM